MGSPNSPRWESEGEVLTEDEGAFSTASRMGNVCNDALHVVGLHGPGDKISLSLFCAGLGVGTGGTCVKESGRKCMSSPSELSWLV